MRKLLPLFLLAVCCSASAEWIPIACADKCEDAMWLYDPQKTIKRAGIVDVWFRQSGQMIKQIGGRKYKERPELYARREIDEYEQNYSYSLAFYKIKCDDRQAYLIQSQDYLSNGNPIGNEAKGDSYRPIYPDSLMDVAAARLCKKNSESK